MPKGSDLLVAALENGDRDTDGFQYRFRSRFKSGVRNHLDLLLQTTLNSPV
jgi:hypothetical protein